MPVRHRHLVAAVAAATLLGPAVSAGAAVVIDSGDPLDPDDDLVLDLAASVGDGLFASYLVVDFSATGGDAFAWEYRWNPGDDARGATMLQAVVDGTALDADIGGEDGVGFGIFVNNFLVEGTDAVGDPDAFWAYFIAEAEDLDPGVAWTSAPFGASFRELSNGSVDGWYNGFDGPVPAVPTVLVPGPAAFAPVAGAFALLGARRRRS